MYSSQWAWLIFFQFRNCQYQQMWGVAKSRIKYSQLNLSLKQTKFIHGSDGQHWLLSQMVAPNSVCARGAYVSVYQQYLLCVQSQEAAASVSTKCREQQCDSSAVKVMGAAAATAGKQLNLVHPRQIQIKEEVAVQPKQQRQQNSRGGGREGERGMVEDWRCTLIGRAT